MNQDTSAQLSALMSGHLLETFDLHFAHLMGRLAEDDSPQLALAAALVSHRTSKGDVCLELKEWGGRTLGGVDGEAEVNLPERGSWHAHLVKSPVVCAPGGYAPLVLDDRGRLYFHRYWTYQQQLAEMLLARTGMPVGAINERRLQQGLDSLFPKSEGVGTDWQKVAAVTAVVQRFCVISGGPGTGKTSTVVRILALLLQQCEGNGLSIALAAPTGKAAARLQTSIQRAVDTLAVEQSVKAAMPDQAVTLHRLLGSRRGSVEFRHNRDNPLPVDLLVIDEASMVDLAMMAKVVDALPATARLILLGDRDQLASVEAGAVLADICGSSAAWTTAFHQRMESLCGEKLPPRPNSETPLSDTVALLHHSYRFGSDSGIGRLAEAVKAGDSQIVLQQKRNGNNEDVIWISGIDDIVNNSVEYYRDYLEAIRSGADISDVFLLFDHFRVLAALRRGALGVEELNQRIERALYRQRLITSNSGWYPGKPVLIQRNDYNLRLYNGDIGICSRKADGSLVVSFMMPEGGIREIATNRITAWESAYAMTVHKSQGSEFDRVLLVLSSADSPVLSRELLYTGITRAKSQLTLAMNGKMLSNIVERQVTRPSGLRDALWES